MCRGKLFDLQRTHLKCIACCARLKSYLWIILLLNLRRRKWTCGAAKLSFTGSHYVPLGSSWITCDTLWLDSILPVQSGINIRPVWTFLTSVQRFPLHNCSHTCFLSFSDSPDCTSASTPVSIHVSVPSHSHHVHALLSEAERTEEAGERGEDGGCFRAGERVRA